MKIDYKDTVCLPKTDFPMKASFLSWIDYSINRSFDNLNKTYEVGDEYYSLESDYTLLLPNSKKYRHNQDSDQPFKFPVRGNYTLEGRGVKIFGLFWILKV